MSMFGFQFSPICVCLCARARAIVQVCLKYQPLEGLKIEIPVHFWSSASRVEGRMIYMRNLERVESSSFNLAAREYVNHYVALETIRELQRVRVLLKLPCSKGFGK